ncbi:MAG: hypothetical protein ACI81W_000551 [Saprospiraceae bacterium]
MGIGIDIYEDSFVKNTISSYNLSALVGADRFSFLAYDQNQQKVQFLKSYNFQLKESEEIKSIVHEVYTQDNLLKSRFNQSFIAITNEKNTLVPERLYDESSHATYFEKLIQLDQGDFLMVNDIPELHIKNIFAMDLGLKNLLDGYFPGAKILHNATLFIKGARELSKHRGGHQLYLNINGDSFQVVLFEDQDLLFSNSYSYKAANDFIYFTMLVFDQFNLKPEAVPLYLSGQITEDSEIYKLIYRYIRHIHFVQLPHFLNFGPRLKNVPSHYYFNLYCAKLCV